MTASAHPTRLEPDWGRLAKARLPVLLLALALSALAQALADRRAVLGLALVIYLAGAVFYVLGARSSLRGRERESVPGERLRVNPPHLLWALVFTALAFASFRHNRITIQGLLPWAVSVLLCFSALAPRPAERAGGAAWRRICATFSTGRWCIPWSTWGVIAAILVGAYLRLYRLLELPADLGWDLPYNYLDAQRVLQGEYFVFFPDNIGREGMFFYLIAAVSRLGKLSPYSIRITSALVGIASIPAIYALARECADRETGTYAALLLATNRWHMALTRSGYRVALMPLFTILALYGLARGLRRGQARDWAWAGLFLGLGLWTYKAFPFALPTLAACTGAYALLNLRRRARQDAPTTEAGLPGQWGGQPRRILAGAGLALLVALVTATPMIRFMVDSPLVYWERERYGAQLVKESLGGRTPWLGLAVRNVASSLLMFNYEGDGNPRFGVPFQRHLGFVSGVLFVLGVAAALGRPRQSGHVMLLLALLGMAAPMTVSMLAGEKPNCFRSSGTIGPALVLAAITWRTLRGELSTLVNRFSHRWNNPPNGAQSPRRSALALSLAVIPFLLVGMVLPAEARETSRSYFIAFRRVAPDVANYSIALEMAKAIASFEDGPTYIKVWPYWYDGRAVTVHLAAVGRSFTAELFDLHPDQPPLAGFHGRMLVLLHPQDVESLATLQSFFPRSAVRLEHYPGGGPSLVIFTGER